MVDIKYFKPVTSETGGTATDVGSFPPPAIPGASVSAALSPSGVLYVAQIASDGSVEVTLAVDDAATIAAPVGEYVAAIYRATLPTYTDGDASILHTDARGRLLVSTGEAGITADVETDQNTAPVTPNGTFPLMVYRATPTVYTDGDAAVLQASLNGNLKTQGTRHISTTTLRSAAILTGSYVTSSSVASAVEGENQLILLVDATLGSLTSIEIRVDFSDDNATFYQETFGLISGGTDSLTLGEHQITVDGLYRIPIPVADQYVRIAAKGTGTVTGSSLEIIGVLSVV